LSRASRDPATQQTKSPRKARAAERARSTSIFHHPAGWAVLLAVITAVAFAPTLRNDFVAFDDVEYVVRHADYNPPSLAKLGHYWTEPYPDMYTPVLWTVWGLLAFVARTQDASGAVHWSALPYHLFNVAAHVGAAVMAFLVLRRLVRSSKAAFLGAAVFALHPMQVEAVAWVAGMKTPLSGFFALWAAWHYLRFADRRDEEPPAASLPSSPGSRRRAWLEYAAATVLFALAMVTKPTTVVLPLILAVIEWLLRGRRPRRWLPALLPWLVFAVALGAVSKHAQPAPMVLHPTLVQRGLIALHSLSFYLNKLVIPYPLIPDYSHTPQALVANLRGLWLGAIPATILLLLGAAFVRRAPWFTAGVVVFALGGVTTLGLISYDYQNYSTGADRYAYLSVFGAAIVVAYAIPSRKAADARPTSEHAWKFAPAVGSMVVVVCAILTFIQCTLWVNSQTLFQYTLQHNPDSLIAYRSLAYLVSGPRHSWQELYAVAREGLEHRPGDPVLSQWLGNAAMGLGRVDEAIAAFRLAVAGDPRGADKLNGLGSALAKAGKLKEAEAMFEAATHAEDADQTNVAIAHENLGILTGRQGRWDQSVRHFTEALRIDPGLPNSKSLLPQAMANRDAATQSRPATAPSAPAAR
jgi:Tfp pilus assembly protein PilF